MIVLGNLMDNKVSERLYCMHQLDVDAAWPGENGCLVQTVHNPMGDGRNFISLGGSDFAGVRRAAQVFIGLLKPEGKSLAVGSLFRLEGGARPARRSRDRAERKRRPRVCGRVREYPAQVSHAGLRQGVQARHGKLRAVGCGRGCPR